VLPDTQLIQPVLRLCKGKYDRPTANIGDVKTGSLEARRIGSNFAQQDIGDSRKGTTKI
jgi:hypothetical protein